MLEDDSKKTQILSNTFKLAAKLGAALRTKEKDLLEIAKFKKKGHGFYYSISDKKFIYINKQEEWYFVPYIDKDERERVCLYSPFLFSMAIFIMVPEEEIEIIGYN